MYKKIIYIFISIALIGIGAFLVSSAGLTNMIITGSFGDPALTGSFSISGNAGVVSFDATPSGFSGVEIVTIGSDTSRVYLTGIFWTQTTGWVTFGNVGNGGLTSWSGGVELLAPPGGSSLLDPWYLTGYAWSENAGWITMDGGVAGVAGVAFLPESTTLTGYAWSNNLGWIPFYSGAVNISNGFIGQVKILGNMGGDKSFTTLYSPGSTFSSVSIGTTLNTIRKNVSKVMRNAGSTKINSVIGDIGTASPKKLGDVLIYKYDANPSEESISYDNIKVAMQTDKIRTFLAIGADIYIDADVVDVPKLEKSRLILALKNDAGQGGNIYIKGTVKKIESSLIAEKSIWSGEETGFGLSRYLMYKQSAFSALPKNQLYILGSVIGHNTIGGGIKIICPSGIDETCDGNSAIKYDWNYFRSYSGSDNAGRAYKDNSLDAFSVVIEHDSRVIQDPPPGMATVL